MRFLVVSILCFIAISGFGQFKVERAYTYKSGNGCYLAQVPGITCGCKCYTYDYEQQIIRVADAYDTTIFNAAQPSSDWKTADFPEAWDTDFRDIFSHQFEFSYAFNDSSERIILLKGSDTSYIVPQSIRHNCTINDQFGSLYDDGEGKLLFTVEGIIHPDSYVDYNNSIIRIKFLVPVDNYVIKGLTMEYNFGTKIVHYHDRPIGYYVIFLRNKQTQEVNKIGFVVEANTLISFPSKFQNSFTNQLITIK